MFNLKSKVINQDQDQRSSTVYIDRLVYIPFDNQDQDQIKISDRGRCRRIHGVDVAIVAHTIGIQRVHSIKKIRCFSNVRLETQRSLIRAARVVTHFEPFVLARNLSANGNRQAIDRHEAHRRRFENLQDIVFREPGAASEFDALHRVAIHLFDARTLSALLDRHHFWRCEQTVVAHALHGVGDRRTLFRRARRQFELEWRVRRVERNGNRAGRFAEQRSDAMLSASDKTPAGRLGDLARKLNDGDLLRWARCAAQQVAHEQCPAFVRNRQQKTQIAAVAEHGARTRKVARVQLSLDASAALTINGLNTSSLSSDEPRYRWASDSP